MDETKFVYETHWMKGFAYVFDAGEGHKLVVIGQQDKGDADIENITMPLAVFKQMLETLADDLK